MQNSSFIFLTEVWLPQNLTDYCLPGYKFLTYSPRLDTESGRHGGTAVFVVSDFKYDISAANEIKVTDDCQVSHIQISDLHMYLVYRSPSQSYDNFEKFVHFFESIHDDHWILIGDLNCPTIDWAEDYASEALQKRLLNHVAITDSAQYVEYPTHQDGNILDIVISTPNLVSDVIIKQRPKVADHYNLYFTVEIENTSNIEKTISSPHKVDKDKFAQIMRTIDWCSIDYSNPDEAAHVLSQFIYQNFDLLTPKSVLKPSSKNGFLSSTNNQINKVKTMRSLKTCSVILERAERTLEEMLKFEQTRKESAYVKFLEKDKANIYKTFSKKRNKQQITKIRLSDGSVSDNPRDIADRLNLFYSSILRTSEKVEIDWFSHQGLIDDVEITETKVLGVINSIKTSNCRGPDQVSTRMLKLAPEYIVTPMTLLFRSVLKSGKLPKIWKVSVVNPIPKGSKNSVEPTQTRPISCECVIAKILEKIIAEEIMTKLETSNYFDPRQFGFRKHMSTSKCLYTLFNDVNRDLLDGWIVVLLTIDLSKCFDLVLHDKLLLSSHEAGITGNIGRYLEDWTKERTQYVKFGVYESPHVAVNSSVIQGSCLGPFLFLLLNNSAYENLADSVLYTYCDDGTVKFRFKYEKDLLAFYHDFHRYYAWACEKGHKFNLDKTFATVIGSDNYHSLPGLRISGHKIEVIDTINLLGVIFSAKKGFEPHRESIITRVTRAVNASKVTLKGASFAVKAHVYELYIKSVYMYCCETYVNMNVLRELDNQYRSYFGYSRPEQNDKIPLPPSIQISLHCLKIIHNQWETDKFASLAGARCSLSVTSRAYQCGLMFSDGTTRPPSCARECLANVFRPMWNNIRLRGLKTEHEYLQYLLNFSSDLNLSGARFLELLKEGRLSDQYHKRFKIIKSLSKLKP